MNVEAILIIIRTCDALIARINVITPVAVQVRLGDQLAIEPDRTRGRGSRDFLYAIS